MRTTSRACDDDEFREAVLSSASDTVELSGDGGMHLMRKASYLLAGVLFCIAVWWLFAYVYNTFMAGSIEFPAPPEVFARLGEFVTGQFSVLGSDIAVHLGHSLKRWAEGFLIAFVIGAALGIAMGSDDRLYRFGSVPVNILQMIPGLAWYPVCILLFGLGENSAIFIISITAISPIAIGLCSGIRRVPEVNRRVAQMCGKTRMETLVEVSLPFASIDLINGVRIGMANAWRMLIAAEMIVGVAVGLRYAIQIETAYLDYTSAFACIVLICVIGIVIDKVILANIENYMSRRLGLEVSE